MNEFKRETLHAEWAKMRDRVNEILGQHYKPHGLLVKFFESLGISGDLFGGFTHEVQSNFESALLGPSYGEPLSKIASNTHKIWLTDPKNPYFPPSEYIASYLSSLLLLPANVNHFLWVNSDEVRATLAEILSTRQQHNIFIMEIEQLRDAEIYPTIERLINDRKYVLACDVAKFLILYRFGGVYGDLGVTFDNILWALIQQAEYGVIIHENFFQTSFIAAPAQSDFVALFLSVLARPWVLDRTYALMGAMPTGLDEVRIFAGPGFTMCALLFLPRTARTVILPPQSPHHVWKAQQSWYGDLPKHGNVLISDSAPSVLKVSDFIESEHRFDSFVKSFGNPGQIKEKIRILLGVEPFFREHVTRFCRSFYACGSDKALGWHNYGFLYNFILGQLKDVRGILEVGIGTNFPDVPSSMGVLGTPGASLRAWQELFPNSLVIGADVDERTLFYDKRIITYFVDQRDEGTIQRLLEDIGERPVDIIIDDGLHTFDANRRLLTATHRKLEPGGLYIVEDVQKTDLHLWKEFLETAEFNAILLSLPNENNHSDNNLVIILP